MASAGTILLTRIGDAVGRRERWATRARACAAYVPTNKFFSLAGRMEPCRVLISRERGERMRGGLLRMCSIDWNVLRCELAREFGGRSRAAACVEGATVDDDIQAAMEDTYGMSAGTKPLPRGMALPLSYEQAKELARGR